MKRMASVSMLAALLCLPACSNEPKDTAVQELRKRETGAPAAGAGQSRPNRVSPSAPSAAGAVSSPPVSSTPVIKFARILPNAPNRDSAIEIEAEAEGGESVMLSYEWFVNGRAAGREQTVESPSRLRGGLRKGDRVEARIIPSMGGVSGEPVLRSLVIGNSPPVMEQSPVDVTVAGGVQAFRIAAADPDGDTLSFRLSDAPEGMSIDQATGVVRWKLPDSAGNVSFTVIASDPDGGQSVLNVTAGVKPAARKNPGK
ncbi:MAG: Ig-like domain-containing protein [Nitrospirae bacterium]|nr:Ig-like domain-containing protein [Nitrospirota bacterium]